MDVFGAGSETTGTTAIWAMSELARNPRITERAQSEIQQVLMGKTEVVEADIQGRLLYLQLVITLRLHPPVPLLLPRLCADPTNIMGYDIPLGATVFVNAWTIGMDEKSWPNANEFNPERFEDGAIEFQVPP
ncbi:hypothetical protein ACP4OV_019950 [Aristida adscensionis]